MITFSSLLLWVSVPLIAFLLLYSLLFLCVVLATYVGWIPPRPEGSANAGEITVLIPSHNEGEGLIGTIDSLLSQDYSGPITIRLLLKDREDNSLAVLSEKFGVDLRHDRKEITLLTELTRSVTLQFTGFQDKRERLNAVLPQIESPFIGFLDADHRAEHDWISTSLSILTSQHADGVQARRAPLSLGRTPQIVDSAQNHVGNELLNTALFLAGSSVFFTGTTCIFKKEALAGKVFKDCLTEDTYLSYELLSEGREIAYNPYSGSREEIAPDIYSYLARRRRWSNGHNQAFLGLGRKILTSSLSLLTKLKLVLHGCFYLVPVVACLLLNIYAAFLFVQLTPSIQAIVGVLSALLAVLVAFTTVRRYGTLVSDSVVALLWIWPQIAALCPLALKYSKQELYYFLISFPYTPQFLWVHIFCLIAPIITLLIGMPRMKVLHLAQISLLVISYPVFLFLDLYSCLLGVSDFLLGRRVWAKINRNYVDARLLGGAPFSTWRFLAKGMTYGLALAFVLILFNDLTATSNCGQPTGLLSEPILFGSKDPVTWSARLKRQITPEGRLKVTVFNRLERHGASTAPLYLTLGGDTSEPPPLSGNEIRKTFSFERPLGWHYEKHSEFLKGPGIFCSRDISFKTQFTEIRDKRLFVNGEEFLIKGVIPSFSSAQLDIPLQEGLAQIKNLGANAVRVYHEATPRMRRAAARQDLIVLEQPDDSTWEIIEVASLYDRKQLLRRFDDLYAENEKNPYSLFPFLGNELEIFDPQQTVTELFRMFSDLNTTKAYPVYAYSTFSTYNNYPVPILGVNMLDSGETYWHDALNLVSRFPRPLIASEFGGFVAFFEKTPQQLRLHRILQYTRRLNELPLIGTIFFQSHDNWAQPVPQGYNDPLSNDQPDDERGIWNNRNRAKDEARFVEFIYRDLDYEILDRPILKDQRSLRVKLTNRRRYTLYDLRLIDKAGRIVSGPMSFPPQTERVVDLPLPAPLTGTLMLSARYTTHSGLRQSSKLNLLLPLRSDRPIVLNEDFVKVKADSGRLEGVLLESSRIKVSRPEPGIALKLNGKRLEGEEAIIEEELHEAVERLVQVEISKEGRSWSGFEPSAIGAGNIKLRFKLPRIPEPGALLMLSGLGSLQFTIRYGENGREFSHESHKYRDNLVPLEEFGPVNPETFFYVELNRNQLVYVGREYHPFGEKLDIEMERPKIFSPARVVLEWGKG